jgi:tetratricopeptide (TPR) repeat protein
MSLARATLAWRGYGPEAEDAFQKALQLAEATGTRQFSVLRALATFYMGTARFELGAATGRQLLELGEEAGDESMLVEGHYVYGAGKAFSGDLEAGIDHLERAIALHDPARHDHGRFRLGPNTGVVARTALGLIRWQCGEAERGLEWVEEALEVARQIDHPYSIAYALHHNGLLALYRGRFEETVKWTRELTEVSEANDYPVWRTLASVFEGVATCHLGDPETGLSMTERGIELYQGLTAPPVFWPQLLALQAMAHGAAGLPERGLELIDEALAITAEDPVNSAELKIVKGDLLVARPEPSHDEAEDLYRAAANGASLGSLSMIQLQALNRLVGLRRQHGETPDGSEELGELYRTFTEGFDELELKLARALLAG